MGNHDLALLSTAVSDLLDLKKLGPCFECNGIGPSRLRDSINCCTQFVVGAPGKVIRTLISDEIAKIAWSANHYVENFKRALGGSKSSLKKLDNINLASLSPFHCHGNRTQS